MSDRPLRVCLDARLADGAAGGIQQFIMGLASGLSQLTEGDEEYWFLSDPDQRGWLTPHLSGRCRPLDVDTAPAGRSRGWARTLRRTAGRAIERAGRTPLGHVLPVAIPAADAAVERAGVDVMHFTVQTGFKTSLPSIYQPYDLQHVHLPEFFTPYVRHWRDVVYREFARQASSVVVMSSWVKSDVVRYLGIPDAKVQVIPWAPVTEEYPVPSEAEVAAARARLSLPDVFALYPAQTFPHKNHLRLADAVAKARDGGHRLRVVCPGKRNEHFEEIARRVRALGVEDLVSFPGYVTPLELRCLYRLARLLVFPSLFEGGGMPIFEAFAAGVPVACSNVTCLPAQVGDAALVFDPADPSAIAQAMVALWGDARLRETLVRRGSARVSAFTWSRSARTYRALYRRLAGRPLRDDERMLLDGPPLT